MKSSQTETNIILSLICRILKKDVNELIYKKKKKERKPDSYRFQKQNLWLPKEKVVGRDKLGSWETYNQDLLYSMWNCT